MPNVALLKVKLKEGTDTASLFGSHDAHLKMIEEALGIRVSARGEEVLLNGPAAAVRNGERLLDGLTNLMSEGATLRRDDVEYAIRNLMGGQDPPGLGSYLVTEEAFDDFELQIEVRPDADAGRHSRLGRRWKPARSWGFSPAI